MDLEVIEGERVDYGHSPSRVPCGGNAGSMDGFPPFLERGLGVQVAGHVWFAWLDEEAYDAQEPRACEGTIGCARRYVAVSRRPDHFHEVAHTLLYPLNRRPLPFLREGLATALDASHHFVRDAILYGEPMRADPRPDLAAEVFNYDEASLFVLYLFQVHGPEKLVEFYRRSGRGSDLATVEALFRDVYALELDDAAEAYLAGEGCTDAIRPVPWYECEAPAIDPAEGRGWTFERRVECADPDVRGGLDNMWGIHVDGTFTVEEPGLYAFEFAGDGEARVYLKRCDGCAWLEPSRAIRAGNTREVEMAAGKYMLSTRLFDQEGGDVRVRFAPVP